MDINKYILFADVAATKNFTKSGERMGYTQPGVSHVLKAMERELVKLFTPLRVTEYDERMGLDESQHGESAYPSFNGLD